MGRAVEEVTLVRTGTANLASVSAAVRRLGCAPVVVEDPDAVVRCRRLILPGVGTLRAAMRRLEALGLPEALRERVRRRAPTLAICLGMQILCDGSEESEGVEGLGAIAGKVAAFSDSVRVPQLGWNSTVAPAGARLLDDEYYYFANSYRLVEAPSGWRAAMCDYGGPFVAAVEDGGVLACQFHPELSGRAGLGLLRRWIDSTGGGGSC